MQGNPSSFPAACSPQGGRSGNVAVQPLPASMPPQKAFGAAGTQKQPAPLPLRHSKSPWGYGKHGIRSTRTVNKNA